MTTTTKSRSKAPRGRRTETARVDVYQEVTDRVVEALAAGTAPWRKPWNVDHGMPLSLSTRKPYRGMNIFLLGLAAQTKGYRSPWWGTYNAIVKAGGKVRTATCEGERCRECGGSLADLRAGDSLGCGSCGGSLNTSRPGVRERGTHVIFWKIFETKEINPATNKPVTSMVLRQYYVFNSEQADWEPGKEPAVPDYSTRTDGDRLEAAEAIVAGYPAPPKISANGRAAYYRPDPDAITVPPLAAFDNLEEYYSTLFHELTHSTGHKKRLDRPGITEFDHFGSEKYGKEELVAEMGAALLSGLCGLTLAEKFENSAAYLASWLDTLREDRKLVVLAAAAAQKAADHILGITWQNDETNDKEEGSA